MSRRLDGREDRAVGGEGGVRLEEGEDGGSWILGFRSWKEG